MFKIGDKAIIRGDVSIRRVHPAWWGKKGTIISVYRYYHNGTIKDRVLLNVENEGSTATIAFDARDIRSLETGHPCTKIFI